MDTAEGLLRFLVARLEPDGAVLLAAQSWSAPSQGAELLAPALRDTLHSLGLDPAALTRIAVVRGPGSFTGIRLALATAAGLSRATGALCAGLEYLPLLALSAARRLLPAKAGEQVQLWPVTHARRGLVHTQGFVAEKTEDNAPPALRPLSKVIAGSADDVARAVAETDPENAPLLFGTGLAKNRQALLAAFAALTAYPAPLPLSEAFNHPDPEALLLCAATAPYGKDDIAPLYVRASDAEENLANIAASLRLPPEEAVKRMTELTSQLPEC